MQEINSIFYVVILILSVVIHEVAHGYAALYWGDQTAKYAGRLTLNPIKHLDLMGSVIIPLFLVFSGTGFIFGWAKPVPYNPNNLRDKKWGTVAVAAAGIGANLLIAIVFGLLIRLAVLLNPSILTLNSPLIFIASSVVFVNILLAVFNLVPIPPLDGSKILFSFLPPRLRHVEGFLNQYSIFLMLIFILFLWKFIAPVIFFIHTLFTGITF